MASDGPLDSCLVDVGLSRGVVVVTGDSEGVNRPFAEQGRENRVQIRFPDRSPVIILSDDRARELAEEMIEIVEEDDHGDV